MSGRTIRITSADAGRAAVKFDYDPDLVEMLKRLVPGYGRRWHPDLKVWLVDELDVGLFVNHARSLGYKVDDHRRPKQPPRVAPAPTTDWAAALFRAVGPARHEAVFKALTRVLHPDVTTGDTVLMQDLNRARAQIGRAA